MGEGFGGAAHFVCEDRSRTIGFAFFGRLGWLVDLHLVGVWVWVQGLNFWNECGPEWGVEPSDEGGAGIW